MKKIFVLMLALVMVMSLVACGGGDAAAAPASSTPASSAPASSAPASSDAVAPEASSEELEFTLDYDTIAAWVFGGYLGQTDDGAPALLAIDEAAKNAIVIFADNTTMEAVSFIGEMTENTDSTVTISDPESGLSITFDFLKGDTTYTMDMGEEMGSASLVPVEKTELLAALKGAIENYKHVA